MTGQPRFLIVTPARNEAGLIERTLASVIAQDVLPSRWLIVDDGSSDATAEIVRRHVDRHPFIRLLQIERSGRRGFGHKADAFNAGLASCRPADYDFIGNLDADISLPSDYYARILQTFATDERLGLAGGMVQSRVGVRFVSQEVSLDSVAGAVQLFRRQCFEEIGGYVALPEGGIDSAAEIMARMHGWRVRTLPWLSVREHRRTGTAEALPIVAKLKEGRRLQSLGYSLLFVCLRCVYRAGNRPRLIGSVATLAGYLQRALQGSPPVLPPEVVGFLREEQGRKLKRSLRRGHVRYLRNF